MPSSLHGRVTKASDYSDFMTPHYATEILIPFLKAKNIDYVWEPACGFGHIAEALEKHDIKVYQSDIKDMSAVNPKSIQKDFLMQNDLPDRKIKAIITNPPYNTKDKFMKRCYDLEIPFALLMPVYAIGSQSRVEMYIDKGIELLVPDKRVNYIYSLDKNHNWFHSCWFCHGILPETLMFTRMERSDDKNSSQGRFY
jgi:hypothetical protein